MAVGLLWDGKVEFSASLLQSSVSHDSLGIIPICWFVAQETFFINVEWADIFALLK